MKPTKERQQLVNFISKRPYLIWYVKNYQKLSDRSILEHTLNYGDWEDVKKLFEIMGIKKAARIFRKQMGLPRCNYSPMIANYFDLYFKKYAKI